ncbi:Hypothetical predicted protein [Lynx pardinus]|uniref:Uncharacterized protein n=1 Tax=Lynx pardinus TaxID=191816 RepID=A0A485M7Y4_LYNPA|nr:Hypothetical predicted protein [Lynx pardinus]
MACLHEMVMALRVLGLAGQLGAYWAFSLPGSLSAFSAPAFESDHGVGRDCCSLFVKGDLREKNVDWEVPGLSLGSILCLLIAPLPTPSAPLLSPEHIGCWSLPRVQLFLFLRQQCGCPSPGSNGPRLWVLESTGRCARWICMSRGSVRGVLQPGARPQMPRGQPSVRRLLKQVPRPYYNPSPKILTKTWTFTV